MRSLTDTNQASEDELDKMLDAHAALYAQTTMQFITGEITEDERDKEWYHSDLKTKHAILALISNREKLARIDENESLLSVAEHEIELGDKCHNHDKHTPACYACRKRKMYVEYSKDWQKSINERIITLLKELDGGQSNA